MQFGRRVSIVVLVFLVAGEAGAAVRVALRERATLNASVVRLSDVAEIEPADEAQSRMLASLPIMPSPAPGKQRFLRRQEIADLLAAHGVDLQELQFAGADQVEVASDAEARGTGRPSAGTSGQHWNRHAAILAGQAGAERRHDQATPIADTGRGGRVSAELNRAIASYLETKAGQAATWRVSCEVADRYLALLARATAPPQISGGNPPWTGRQRFLVEIRTAEGAMQLPVYAEVGATSIPVVVAVQPIGRGEPITAADVALQAVDHLPAANGRRIAVESVESLIGMEARQSIRAGEVVFSDQVQPPLLVKRGDAITVSSHAGGIRVRTTARARENGARGDLVQVESLETRERFEARVVGPREAAVFAPARVAATPRPIEAK
jgi:flagella basal body P-ring formation protein FlgA